jgi:hypothetical protein
MAFQVACRAGQRHRGFKTYCERDIDGGADTDGEQAAPAQDELDYDGGGDADEGGNRRSGESQEAAPTSGHGEDVDWRRRIQPPMTAIPYLAISVSNFHQLFPAKPSSANSL